MKRRNQRGFNFTCAKSSEIIASMTSGYCAKAASHFNVISASAPGFAPLNKSPSPRLAIETCASIAWKKTPLPQNLSTVGQSFQSGYGMVNV